MVSQHGKLTRFPRARLWLLRDNVGMADELPKAPQDSNPAGVHPFHDPAYPDHFSFPGLPKHFSIVSAQKTGSVHDQALHDSLHHDLTQAGLEATSVKAHYGHPEESFLVTHSGSEAQQKKVEEIAWKYNQDAVIHHSENKNTLTGKDGTVYEGEGIAHGPHIQSYYTQLPTGHRFQLNVSPEPKKLKKADKPFDLLSAQKKKRAHSETHPHHYGIVLGLNIFHATHEDHANLAGLHIHNPNDEQFEEAVEKAKADGQPAVVIHGDHPPMLWEGAPASPHPHAYDWHDGNTDHYSGDLGKAESFSPAGDVAPAMAPVSEHHSGNDQAAGKGISTYRPIAEHFGSVLSGHKTNLKFYPGLERHEGQIDKMIGEHGFQTYFAGGKHGKPDLKDKNYNTGHLMVWNPAPGSGGDFQDESHTRSWRKIHELAHALTYPEVNQLYGEGRRLGKLGVRTPRESKRAVHWEWLAAHKQRELSEKMGVKISDEDFHRELNTIMHDAVHRAVTGQFAEPSDEGFVPSKEKIPLEHSMKLIDEHSQKAGLHHEEATFRSTGVPRNVSEGYQTVTKSDGLSGELLQGGKIKKFYLWREQDESGVSGTGRVAEGVIFSNGWVGMNWLTRWGSLAFYPSISDCLTVHGHQGKTKVVYEDCEPGSEHMIALPAESDAEVKKAFLQGDGETLTDPKSHDAANQAVPQALMDWGVKNLVPMAIDHQGEFELGGKVIKVRKVLEDLYSGWVEHENKIIHSFEKVTLPLVLSQLQSKLELYGKEEAAVADKPIDPGSFTGPADISSKIKELQEQVRSEIKETLTAKELVPGIENPEKECPACERPVDQCVCYTNLPVPRVEITPKGVNIFFKSEWSEEDISNFKTDLCRRAGSILKQRRLEKAKAALAEISQKMKK